MPKRSSKKKRLPVDRDENQIAADALRRLTGEDRPPASDPDDDARKLAARILGSLGGKKGGPARAASLSAKKRADIAKKAAAARWGKGKG